MRLESSTVQTRGEVLHDVLYLAIVEPAGLDAESLVPVLLSIASRDGDPQFRIMAAQAFALLGTRADLRNLGRITRRESSPRAKRHMQLAAAARPRRRALRTVASGAMSLLCNYSERALCSFD